MSCVHYKFSSKRKLENSTVTFDGLHITLKELKKQIMGRERLKARNCDLQITNAQTREEYTDDEVHIPKHSSVTVRRTPLGGVRAAGRTFIVDRSDTAVVGPSRPILLQTDSSPSMSLAQLAKTANLVDANASEDDKIKAMMLQSSYEYHPIHYSKKAVRRPTARYTWHRCGKAGPYIRQRPMLLAVNNFKNETGYTKLVRKQVQQAALPPPCLQMSRPLHSRQQDPLLANVTLPPPAIVPTAIVPIAAPQTQVQPPPPSPMYSTGQGEPPPPGEFNPEPTVRRSPESIPEIGPHGYHLSVLGPPPPIRLPHPPLGHQSRPHHPHRERGHWEKSFTGREDHPPAHLQTAPPPEPAPPLYPSQYLYPPPPQSYPPPYTSGLLPPPFGYPTQPIYAPGPPGRNPHWIPPRVQPPHRGPPYSQPPLPKEYCYRQSHRQDKTTSKLDEFTKDFHKELMKYRNPPKRRRPSYSRSRSFSRSPFSRSVCPPSRSRSRSRSYSYSQSRSRSRSRSHGRSFPRSPYARHNGHSYRRLGSKSRSHMRSPPPFRARPWEGAEGPAPFRSRSRSPGGFRNRSPGGRKPPPRELPPYELKGPSPGGHDRWERERHRQWEKDYRDYSPQGRGRRGREERGAPPHHPPSSSSSGTKSSTKVLKTKKVKKKRPGEEPETSHHSADRGDATPVRDEPMDEIPSINKTPPSSSKPASGSGVAKAPTSKSPAAPAKPSNKTVSRTQSDKTRKEKAQKVKPKVKTEAVKTEAVKTEAVKAKNDKVKKKTAEVVVIKKKDSSSSSSSSVAKPVKTIKVNPEDHIYSTIPQKEKSSRVRPPLLKTPPLSSQILIPSLLPLVAPEGKDGEEQTQVKSKPRISRKVEISPYSSHNGHSYRRLGSKSRSRLRSPPPFRAGPWEGAEGPAPFRSRSRSPGGFRNRSPGGRKPPPRELPPYELKGPSPGGHDRWERERHRQWEKDYRDYSPQGRGRRGREERGAPPRHPPSSSSSGTKSSTKVLKTKKVKKKRPGEEPETSHHSADCEEAVKAKCQEWLERWT